MILHDAVVKAHNRNFAEVEFLRHVKFFLPSMGHQWDVDGGRSGPPIQPQGWTMRGSSMAMHGNPWIPLRVTLATVEDHDMASNEAMFSMMYDAVLKSQHLKQVH